MQFFDYQYFKQYKDSFVFEYFIKKQNPRQLFVICFNGKLVVYWLEF